MRPTCGHHIQYELDLFDEETSPEATRRTELMADSFASYWAVHKKGLTLNAKRVVDTLLSFYTVGDCFVEDDGHHGTRSSVSGPPPGAPSSRWRPPRSPRSCWPPRSPPASSSSCPSSSPPTPESHPQPRFVSGPLAVRTRRTADESG